MQTTQTESEKDAAWLKGELDKVQHDTNLARLDAATCLAAIRRAESACDVHNPRKSVELTRLKEKLIGVMQDFDAVLNKGASWHL